jgi:hypothetical protein
VLLAVRLGKPSKIEQDRARSSNSVGGSNCPVLGCEVMWGVEAEEDVGSSWCVHGCGLWPCSPSQAGLCGVTFTDIAKETRCVASDASGSVLS